MGGGRFQKLLNTKRKKPPFAREKFRQGRSISRGNTMANRGMDYPQKGGEWTRSGKQPSISGEHPPGLGPPAG